MRVFFVKNINATDQWIDLPSEEAKHIVKVLRLKIGDKLILTNGRGLKLETRISLLDKKQIQVEVLNAEQITNEKKEICLIVAPLKNPQRMEWLVEKAVEIGVGEIVWLRTQNTEAYQLNFSRLEKKAIAGLKQSQQFVLPQMSEIDKVEDLNFSAYSEVFLAHCESKLEREELYHKMPEKSEGKWAICVGPEGDFTSKEISYLIEKGAKPVALGKNRLRTETAAMVALTLLNQKKYVEKN